jgi:hypothetical protein
VSELSKLAGEARDNVKFLATLERHFKSISSGPLAGIADTLPPLMNALRMVRRAAPGAGGWLAASRVPAAALAACRRDALRLGPCGWSLQARPGAPS